MLWNFFGHKAKFAKPHGCLCALVKICWKTLKINVMNIHERYHALTMWVPVHAYTATYLCFLVYSLKLGYTRMAVHITCCFPRKPVTKLHTGRLGMQNNQVFLDELSFSKGLFSPSFSLPSSCFEVWKFLTLNPKLEPIFRDKYKIHC